jgi:hypothetical protein
MLLHFPIKLVKVFKNDYIHKLEPRSTLVRGRRKYVYWLKFKGGDAVVSVIQVQVCTIIY